MNLNSIPAPPLPGRRVVLLDEARRVLRDPYARRDELDRLLEEWTPPVLDDGVIEALAEAYRRSTWRGIVPFAAWLDIRIGGRR